ncbi:hypothetical protein [Aquipuribacter hungaricus]|uniref:Integral membrane protein n=1 Tax=Aquipuribacter hungaricus TaxID=545624 RepID=A0ABV7WFY7_9MICO
MALVCVAVAPPVGIVLAYLARRETHPVTGTRSGRELAAVALWVNVGLTGLLLLMVLSVLAQLLGVVATTLPVLLGGQG